MQAIGKHQPMLLSVVHLKEAPAIVRRGIEERMSSYQPITEGCQLSVVSCRLSPTHRHAACRWYQETWKSVASEGEDPSPKISDPECLGTYKGKGE